MNLLIVNLLFDYGQDYIDGWSNKKRLIYTVPIITNEDYSMECYLSFFQKNVVILNG